MGVLSEAVACGGGEVESERPVSLCSLDSESESLSNISHGELLLSMPRR